MNKIYWWGLVLFSVMCGILLSGVGDQQDYSWFLNDITNGNSNLNAFYSANINLLLFIAPLLVIVFSTMIWEHYEDKKNEVYTK